MSMSVDERKLDTISRFADFIDAISKPEELRATVETLQKEAAILRDLLAAKDTVDKANAFMDECRKEMQKGFDDLDAQEAEFQDRKAKWEELNKSREDKLEAQRQAQETLAKELSMKTSAVEEAIREMEVRSQKSALWQRSLEDMEMELAKREVALAEKAVKIKMIVGD